MLVHVCSKGRLRWCLHARMDTQRVQALCSRLLAGAYSRRWLASRALCSCSSSLLRLVSSLPSFSLQQQHQASVKLCRHADASHAGRGRATRTRPRQGASTHIGMQGACWTGHWLPAIKLPQLGNHSALARGLGDHIRRPVLEGHLPDLLELSTQAGLTLAGLLQGLLTLGTLLSCMRHAGRSAAAEGSRYEDACLEQMQPVSYTIPCWL